MTLKEKLWFAYSDNTDKKDVREIADLFVKVRQSLTTVEQLSLFVDYATALSASSANRERAAFMNGFSLGHALSPEIQNPDAQRKDC